MNDDADDETLHEILGSLSKLESEVSPLKAENKELKRRIEYLEYRNTQNLATIRRQEIEISTLKTRLDKLEKPKKDSHNSSIPPSKEDIYSSEERKHTKSLYLYD